MLEVGHDLTFVPGGQDRFDVREVLVQRRASDAGFLGDLRHRHRADPALGNEAGSGLDDRLADGAAVLLDRRVPQLRHDQVCIELHPKRSV